jgi:2,3-dimethylmalate lyase
VGATLIFVDGIETRDEVRRVIAEIDAPVSINMVEGGRTPLFTFAELQDLGAARVSCPVTTILAAMQGVKDALAALKADGAPMSRPDRLAGFSEIKARLGADAFDALAARFAAREQGKDQP